MSNDEIVADHLKAALLAASADKPFLAYLIQMALIESKSTPEELQFRDVAEEQEQETPDYEGASNFLSRLPSSQQRMRNRNTFI